jgi:hypothetical protein
MKRTLVLTIMALIVAIVGVQPLFAQDISFGGGPFLGGTQALPEFLPGLTNQGVTGASRANFLLNTSTNQARGIQPSGLATFNVRDIGVGDFTADGLLDIFAVSSDRDSTNTLVNQGILFAGQGDGTFGPPVVMANFGSTGVPTSVAVTDIDLDGISDVAIGRTNNTIRVITGSAMLGAPTNFDTVLTGPAGTAAVSVAFGRINDDVFQDVIGAFQNTAAPATPGMVVVFPTNTTAGTPYRQ